MDLTHLSVSLGDIMSEESGGGGLFEQLSRLVAKENWDGIAYNFGDETVATIKKEVEARGKYELVALLGQIAKEKTEKLNREIKQALKDATSFQLRGSLGDKLLQLHKRADDQTRKYGLLAVAFADRLTDLVFPAAERAAKLTNLIVKERPTPEAEKYLEEACLCYFYELYSASAIMCRAILEEAIEKRFEQFGIDPRKELNDGTCTLGALLRLGERRDVLRRNVIPVEALREMHTVNDLGSRAVHEEPLSEKDAWECLTAARHALGGILR
jgi:hypothetical protein